MLVAGGAFLLAAAGRPPAFAEIQSSSSDDRHEQQDDAGNQCAKRDYANPAESLNSAEHDEERGFQSVLAISAAGQWRPNAVRLRLRSLTWATWQPPSVRMDDEGAMTSPPAP
jgi:hypothetical protein